MGHCVLEIIQTNDLEEPSFELWVRRMLLFEPGRPNLVVDRKLLAMSDAVPGPDSWPVPADKGNSLSKALSWYLETYILEGIGEQQKIAEYIVKALSDWGEDVFKVLFSNPAAIQAYRNCCDETLGNRIEIFSDDPKIHFWPWEALLDFDRFWIGSLLPVERVFTGFRDKEELKHSFYDSKKIKVLLVSARGRIDVDYRLVGEALASAGDAVSLTLLNPPTLENLANVLKSGVQRFDVLHFDCHGGFGSFLSNRKEGYLLLENNNLELVPVTSEQLRAALGDYCPPHIVLNACRSAMASYTDSRFTQSLAISLLAHDPVYDVTAMSYNLATEAMKHFLLPFYNGLLCNLRTGAAVESARGIMMRNKLRVAIDGEIEVDDWMIPVVYRRLKADENDFKTYLERLPNYDNKIKTDLSRVDQFIGRDKLFYDFDRSLIYKGVIFLIHGLAGIGKTRFIKEYLLWKSRTGDLRPVIWLDLEVQNDNNKIMEFFAESLRVSSAIALGNTTPESVILNGLAQNNYYIILDNVHAARIREESGFQGIFTVKDRAFLAQFLRQCAATGSTVLSISRGPEPWIGEEKEYFEFSLNGLEPRERISLIQKTLDDFGARLSAKDFEAKTPGFTELLAEYGGHPLLTVDLVNRVLGRETCANFLQTFQTDMKAVKWFLEKNDRQRLLRSLSIVDDADVLDVGLFFLFFKNECCHELFLLLLKEIYPGEAEKKLKKVFGKLELAGLLHNGKAMHPLLVAGLKSTGRMKKSHYHYAAFLDVIGRLASEGNKTLLSQLDFYTLSLALPELIKTDRIDEAVIVVDLCITGYNEQKLPEKTLQLFQFVYPLLEGKITSDQDFKLLKTAISPEVTIQLLPALNKLIERGEFEKVESANFEGKISQIPSAQYRRDAELKIRENNLEAARGLLKKAISLNNIEKNEIGKAMNYSLLGEVEGKLKNIDQASEYFNKGILIFKKFKRESDAGISFHQWAKYLYLNDDPEKAGENFLNAAECFDRLNDAKMLAAVVANFEYFFYADDPPNYTKLNFKIFFGFQRFTTGDLNKFIGQIIVSHIKNKIQ